MPNIRPLSEELQRIAIEELNEVPERLDEDLATLRTWIEQEPHLRSRTNDQFLVAFLRGSKFSLEKAKSKLENYYTLRSRYPDFYTIRDVESERVKELVRLAIGVPLPIPLNDNGPRIIYVRPGIYPAEKFNFEEVMCVAYAMQGLAFELDDVAMVNGVVTLLDFSNYTGPHILQMTPAIMKKMSMFVELAMPMREKATHMIHTNAAFEAVFNVFRPLMPAKQQARLSVHGNNLDSLYTHVPQKYLPEHLGGEQGSIEKLQAEHWEFFNKHLDYLREEGKYGVDELLRPSDKHVDYDNVFGVDGSFRKLNVD